MKLDIKKVELSSYIVLDDNWYRVMSFIWEDEEKELHVIAENTGIEYIFTFDDDFDRIKYYTLTEI